MPGPVSQRLAEEVTAEVRRQGLVIWLDKDDAYSGFVDDLARQSAAGEVKFPVIGFRKSFLELVLLLEPHGSGLDRQQLLIHMPGFNEESIRQTPVLELYEAGVRFRKSLDTLIREAAVARVAPAEVDAFLAGKPSLREADEWLRQASSEGVTGVRGLLEETGESLVLEALAHRDSVLRSRLRAAEDIAALREHLHRLVGMGEGWSEWFRSIDQESPFDRVLRELAAWIMCVEYVHDLRRPPHQPFLKPLADLSKPVVGAARKLVERFRSQHGDAYEKLADSVASDLSNELEHMKADDLGQVDTFREEEARVLCGAVEALQAGDWQKAQGYCEARRGERSFWLQRDQKRRWAWKLVAEAAAFGQSIADHEKPFAKARSLEEAAQRYAADVWLVDRAHRRWEQYCGAVETYQMGDHYGPLQEVALKLRVLHRRWADDLARTFTELCSEHGFLPPSSLQQRTLYEQVVHPLTLGGEKVAVFMIDALRYEMATELVEELKTGGGIVDLKPRLAELPTITSVGMNALAPVAQGGKLTIAGKLKGIKTGELSVSKPEDRARAMGARSVGQPALLLKLSEVVSGITGRKLGQHRLLLVHSREIDDAGEANVGLSTFESSLQQLVAAWRHLQLAGVKHFVFTADHGFLLQDETTVHKPYGKKTDPSRRHVLDSEPRREKGMVPVSLSSLGYEGLDGYLLFREDTAVFDTGKAGTSFVHGGNSPQERIIPVLTVTRKRAEGSSIAEYMLEAMPDTQVLGLHRVKVRLSFAKETTTSLGFATSRTVDVGLRVPDRPDIRVSIKDVSGPGSLHKGRVRLPLSESWSEIFFALAGPRDESARIEVLHPDNIEKVQSARLDHWFAVSGRGAGAEAPEEVTEPLSWADGIEHEAVRQVFVHIDKHGAITEPEVTKILGSPRAFRRFSLQFDNHVTKLPFRVRIEVAEGGKRYVKEGDK